MNDLTIKEAAKYCDLSIDSLRYYEKEGLVLPKRAENGYRYYSEIDLRHLRYIAVMRYARFSIKEIKFFMNLLKSPPSEKCHEETIQQFKAKKIEIEETIHFYQHILKLLKVIPQTILTNEAEVLESQNLFDNYMLEIYQEYQLMEENRHAHTKIW
ncbi:MerR family Zn(II)-responsive transcriptional regulator of zntA [Enterococcus sp. PF1-24]|uniref:MerR family transcriptional regulator n=1 Tax=unclassified Enterococcus TaxID=2608891 RepID=UPI002473F09D|nr:MULTISPECIES: MerR family transcriptional regulator [unclassified Enterococcus]MDH6364119.1 MerR family Zn(II)-responsive transcriptional regulator of zntA [Enterococcus sp. PFB1-1]MDH6401220.1 MerR family Zn(II)-responsive transcriptional regulator of zntA [Enterococcus sp. PF1-24]